MSTDFRSPSPCDGVAITGIGVVSPIGIGSDEVTQALRAGQSGVRFDPLEYGPWRLKAYVPERFDAKQWVQPRKSLKLMSHEIQLGVAAAAMAMQDAGLSPTADTASINSSSSDPAQALASISCNRLGVVLGTDIMHCPPQELMAVYHGCREANGRFEFGHWSTQAARELNPLWMLKYLPNMAASHVAIAHDARGPSNTLVLGEVSSLLAIIEGADIIRRGRVDAVLAGGTGSLRNPTTRLYHGTTHLSRCETAPYATPRPFDSRRDGTVCGEGAGVLLLERWDSAVARGAKIYGKLVGYGRGMKHLPGPDDDAAIGAAISSALRSADWTADSIDHLNATGRATQDDDRREALAIQRTLAQVPVVAPSSYFGTLGAAGGSIELICSLLALQHGFRPANLHQPEPADECPINLVAETTAPRTGRVLKVSHAWTGQAAALAVEVPLT